ncbi:MAG: heavy metal translocating P-type ATPase [Lachnospiraceae bacterium]
MTKEGRNNLIRIGIGTIIYVCALIGVRKYSFMENEKLIMFLSAYLIMVFGVVKEIHKNLLAKKIFDENILMLIATVGAFLIGKYMEGVAVILFFQVGNICEMFALGSSKKTIAELMDIRPVYANLKTPEGEKRVDPGELQLRDIIIVKPGERIPVDAVITFGNTLLDTQAITGESMPSEVVTGDVIYSGSINMTGGIEAKVVRQYLDSTVSKVLELVEDAGNKKADSERFITRLARLYTPFVVVCALILAIIPPFIVGGNWSTWVYRGLIFLVVACPCGLAVSVPVAFFGGIAAAARRGIIIKGGNFLETLAKADTFVFDKTGTLTQGIFEVDEVKAFSRSVNELLEIVAHVESYSNHPVAQSISEAYGKEIVRESVTKVDEFPGYGMRAIFKGELVYIGNAKLMRQRQIEIKELQVPGTIIYVAVGREYVGYIVVTDSLKEDAVDTMWELKEKYQTSLVMLTGDTKAAGKKVGKELGMDSVYTNLLPEDKLEILEDMMSTQNDTEKLVFVGDGINDAPVLARADVGIAMGALGSDAAIEAADIVLMEDEPFKIVDAIRLSRATMKVVRQNITVALLLKVVVLGLSAFGYISMWGAVFADIGVMLLAILNAIWVLRYPA